MGGSTGITGIIKQFASSRPDKIALIIRDVQISYRELYQRISSAAAYLSSIGVESGKRVVTVAAPELDYVVCEYAILGLGAVNIPTEARISSARLGEISNLIDADYVISHEKPVCSKKWIDYESVEMKTPADACWEPVAVSNAYSEIIFTTGTTGKSKGVMLSSRCLEAYLAAVNPSFGMDADTVFLVTTPLNHVGGLHRIHQCMSVGCTAVILDGIKDIRAFFRSIYDYDVTHTYLPPASIKLLISLARKDVAKLNGKLKFIYTASAPFPSSDIETLMALLPDVRLHQGYGSSETGSICNCQYNAPGACANSLGRPYPCVEVMLHDEMGNQITQPNVQGYIRSKSDMNMLGYYNEPELTREVLIDGFIYSHDLMFFDEKGELHFAGRGDDVINIRGFKVAPLEVEDCALRYEKIADCVCLPFGDEQRGMNLMMFVVMKPGSAFDASEIAAYIEKRLEPYKVPKMIECLPEIPKTYNGKTDRKALMTRLKETR